MSRRFRFACALSMLLALFSAPTLNCMSLFYKMDMQEMACCKDLAGDCDMGMRHDSCCQSSSDPYAANAATTSKVVHAATPTLTIAPAFSPDSVLIASRTTPTEADDGSPPPSPPGAISILRI
jgi:hypothetical protein